MHSCQLEFSPDGGHLACYFGRNVHVWDVGNKTISTKLLLEHISNVSYLEFSPDVHYLAITVVLVYSGTSHARVPAWPQPLFGHNSHLTIGLFISPAFLLCSISSLFTTCI